MMEFQAWPKTPRLFRDMIVTEKIDGTNACVIIENAETDLAHPLTVAVAQASLYRLGAQSRSRLITPENDNHGFATWVRDNAETLVSDLGPGRHYGEWWGQKINRGYGLDHRRFSLFNTEKWRAPYAASEFQTPGLHVVPVIYQGEFSEEVIIGAHQLLDSIGSLAAPGFDNPEGVCVYHTASRNVYKYTPKNGDGHKG